MEVIMTTVSLVIKSIAELAAIVLIIVGVVNESKLVRFERKAVRVAAVLVREHRKKKALEKQRVIAKQRYEAEHARHRKSEPLPEKAYEQRRAQRTPRRVA